MSELHATFAATRCEASIANQKMKRNWKFPSVLAWVLAATLTMPLFGETQYHVDPTKSSVQFSLGGIHEVEGHFAVASGTITLNRTTGIMSGIVQVTASSGDSGNKSRDKKMNKDQLKVELFPTIAFAPAKFTGTLNTAGNSTIQVTGDFTLLGKPHEITVPMTVEIQRTACTAKGSFMVPYVQWGVKDPSMFMMHMDKQVKIDLNFVGLLTE